MLPPLKASGSTACLSVTGCLREGSGDVVHMGSRHA
jgi:hypothetical protein